MFLTKRNKKLYFLLFQNPFSSLNNRAALVQSEVVITENQHDVRTTLSTWITKYEIDLSCNEIYASLDASMPKWLGTERYTKKMTDLDVYEHVTGLYSLWPKKFIQMRKLESE